MISKCRVSCLELAAAGREHVAVSVAVAISFSCSPGKIPIDSDGAKNAAPAY